LQPTHGVTEIGSGTGNSISPASPTPSTVRPWRSLRGDGQAAERSSSAGSNAEPPGSEPISATAKPSTASPLPPYNGVSRGAARVQRGPTVIVAEQPRQEMSVMERLVESRKQDAERAFRWKMARILSMFLIAVSLGWVVWSRIPPGWRSLILHLGQQSAPSPSALDGIELKGAGSGLR
jgi:cobalamin biosynthesis Mg chelatase CobN